MSTFSIGICALLAAVPAIIWSAIFLKRRDKNFKTYIWVFLGGTLTVLPILGYQYVYLALIGDNPDLDFVNKLKGIITGNYWIVFHLMIAGRFGWLEGRRAPPKSALAFIAFESGGLVLTEAGSKWRASIHLAETNNLVGEFDPGGRDIAALELETFKSILTSKNHTL
ncbi:hypothetical protein HOH51_02420, partial [bacterium]|nr:hypothetical protein [bacterium]